MSAGIDPEASLHVQAAISAKREGRTLTEESVRRLVHDFIDGRIADHQMSAWLATVACTGMDLSETAALALAYVDTGKRLQLGDPARPVVDKHSTGGVGDKATLIVVPVVAACGVPVVKLSGRGLGYAGGTVDKLESVPGLRLALDADELRSVAAEAGMVIAGQSDDLAPGDAVTYSLRDVTATVESIPLIAASIISKKLAVGADCVVLDVKYGDGALIADYDAAAELARTMVGLGGRLGLRCEAMLTDMTQPMGRAVGNALEIKEALAVLGGQHVRGVSETCALLSRVMLQSALPELSDEAADERVAEAISSGAALEQFLRWAELQGADRASLEDPELLPAARDVTEVRADRDGWIHEVSARRIGGAGLRVGAGRISADAPLDHGVGILVNHRIGDHVTAGTVLAEIHHNGGDVRQAVDEVTQAFVIRDQQCTPPLAVRDRIRSNDVADAP
ncbi:thymidine phosphorylase [Streptomyces sp. ISL-86]|uniref:thymidine phosphorylase n=1 Tax=Streptomyces sp. ISL-86 TaxID=2819187 RepID=UPI001BE7B264|nr:thymidine phosphorylase [Streptomyces sp. ISL-86]MBT2456060.1 thymidine phosphorylase [Streptomyces sp. ISL-86]